VPGLLAAAPPPRITSGNELWQFSAQGLMERREASINDLQISGAARRIFGPRTEDERGAEIPFQ